MVTLQRDREFSWADLEGFCDTLDELGEEAFSSEEFIKPTGMSVTGNPRLTLGVGNRYSSASERASPPWVLRLLCIPFSDERIRQLPNRPLDTAQCR